MQLNPSDQVLERLPNGDLAWLRPDPDERISITDLGRRALRMAAVISREQLERDLVDIHAALAEALRRLGTARNADLVDVLTRTAQPERGAS